MMIKLLKLLKNAQERKRTKRIEAKTRELIEESNFNGDEPQLTQLKISKDTDLDQLKKDLSKKGLDVTLYEPVCPICNEKMLRFMKPPQVQKTLNLKGSALFCEECKFISVCDIKPIKKFLNAFCKRVKEAESKGDKKAPDGGFLN